MSEGRSERRKNRIKKRGIIISLIILVILGYFVNTKTSFSKYIYNVVHGYYLQTKGFYFNSDKLSLTNTEYEIENNWSGAETYTITVNLNSKKNDLVFAETDIDYNISFKNSDNIECSLNKNTGTIIGNEHGGINEDYFTITINPTEGKSILSGEKVWVDVEVTSTKPYTTTLTGRLIIQVGEEEINYEIVDSKNKPYLEVNITNSLNEAKDVTLEFDPNLLLLDMTEKFVIQATDMKTQDINGHQVVNSITSKINAIEMTSVKFYKNDITQDYSYQLGSDKEPVIKLKK